jgi:hypothetical protein
LKPQPFRYGKLIESEDVVAKPESWRGGVQPRFNAGSRLAVVFVYCVVFLNTSIETHAVPCLTHTCRHAQWQTKVVRDTLVGVTVMSRAPGKVAAVWGRLL